MEYVSQHLAWEIEVTKSGVPAILWFLLVVAFFSAFRPTGREVWKPAVLFAVVVFLYSSWVRKPTSPKCMNYGKSNRNAQNKEQVDPTPSLVHGGSLSHDSQPSSGLTVTTGPAGSSTVLHMTAHVWASL